MQLFIDSADVGAIRRLCRVYPVDGVTTNPTLLAQTRRDPAAVLDEIRAAIGPDRLLFAQAIPTDAAGMLRDARAIARRLGENTVVKVPAVAEGFEAIRQMKAEGIRACGTVVYAPMQAWLAAKAGAEFVAPYVNRIDNLGGDGVGVACAIREIFDRHRLDATVLAASFRNSLQVQRLCVAGIGAATCAPDVIETLARLPAVDVAIDAFRRDFADLCGEGRSMADALE